MQLVINTYGSYLSKKDKCFVVRTKDKETEVSAKKIDSILITTGASFSTDALELAMENNIDIVFLNGVGFPYARVWYPKLGSTTLIRRRQLEISDNAKGFDLAREWIVKKFDNKTDFLQKLSNSRPEKRETIGNYIERLDNIKNDINKLNGNIEENRGSIMGFEGSGGKIYFEAINFIMPDRFKFDGRSRQPAKDEFNCLLNYGYGVLYSLVEKACIIAGLDPFVGFIHTDNYNKKSLVFDLIEMFRIYVDTTVVYLFSQRKVNKEHCDKIRGGLSLNKDGKAILIEALNRYLDESIRYNGRNIKRQNIIQFETHRIANELIKDI